VQRTRPQRWDEQRTLEVNQFTSQGDCERKEWTCGEKPRGGGGEAQRKVRINRNCPITEAQDLAGRRRKSSKFLESRGIEDEGGRTRSKVQRRLGRETSRSSKPEFKGGKKTERALKLQACAGGSFLGGGGVQWLTGQPPTPSG